ncbi:MAG: glucose-1-phosphate adenylyltransferase [Schwartzia sp.]|nr:glucose-1-phosphate adenylyltransferase [Schwartzia sp. (in: firmicutes)]
MYWRGSNVKTRCLAMILAGGQGSRLGVLTAKVAKPAVPFGGKYRIIDFPLSNCAHSGIERVGVLTQYRPFELNNYLGNGNAWDLDGREGGVFILPPYARAKGADWYSGTADAIYQNLNFIEMSDPEYVLILSGDHIYAMDYSKMLDAHISKGAEATIGVIRVPMEEASRFGILDAEPDGRITRFTEKPAQPTSDLASMGIYIFTKDFLHDYLVEDAKREDSSHDFGKDIIPKMLADGAKLFSYSFDGYWKDVGTIESLWQANMDFLADDPPLNTGGTWRIHSANPALPPHYIGPDAEVSHALLNEGAVVLGTVSHSVISSGVRIGKGAKVTDSVVMPFAVIEDGAVVDHAILGPRTKVAAGARIKGTPDSIAVTGENEVVKSA